MFSLLYFSIFINLIITTKCALFAEEISEKTFLSTNISVIHSCSRSHVLCSQISIRITWSSSSEFQYPACIDCSSLRSKNSNRAVLPISISDEFVCSPNYWNPDPKLIYDGKLYLYTISRHHLQDKRYSDFSMLHKLAQKKIVYDLNIPNPNSRKSCLEFVNSCSSFYHKLMYWSFSNWQSPFVQVPIPLAPDLFPSNYRMGYYISLPNLWKNKYFEKFVQSNYKRFTISLWIYISLHCSKPFCNVISFFEDSSESFTSPVLMVTNTGKIHFQVRYLISDSDVAFNTKFSIPVRSWNQIILSMDSFKWYLSVYSLDGSLVGQTLITRFSEKIKFNVIENFGIIGGSQVYDGTHGFFSGIFMYPGVFGKHKQIHQSKRLTNSSLSMSHANRLIDCENFLNELHFYFEIIGKKISILPDQFSCPYRQVFEVKQYEKSCAVRIRDLKRPKIYNNLKHIVLSDINILKIRKILGIVDLRKVLLKESFLLANVVNHLREHMMGKVMENLQINGIKINKITANYLHDCSCLGDPDANYILSAAYFYGIGAVRMNHSKALELSLINVDNHFHRLSLLALGNIHLLGLMANLPQAASVFYKAAADFTPNDIEKYENKDMYNDNIRLTNEAQIKEHTDEDGDLFEWIKHQASAGIPWAKQRLGRIFYWGGQGIRRNLNQAMNFFRQAAEAPEAQPGDHFDYGLLLVKKPNNDKDMEKGKAELKKAGKEDPRALTVLGWLAETKENNILKAFQYYKQAYSMGNADATFNLGIYYHYGKQDIIKKDKTIAFKYFEKAAFQNQLDAGVMYSHYLMSGLQGFLTRDSKVAVNWARHVAEQNPKIGFYLSEGVRSYRKRKTELSVFYYLLAAYSGIELANFNVALLCDDKEEIVKKYVEKECTWYHYNLSVQREEHFIHPYSLIKLGDRHWYGCLDGIRDINKSIEFYVRAAQKGEPQAFFNLAFIFENENVNISLKHLNKIIRVPKSKSDESQDWRYDVVLALYKKCEHLSETDSYLPCRLAIQRLKVTKLWREMKVKIQIIVTIATTLIMLYKFLNLWSRRADPNAELSFP